VGNLLAGWQIFQLDHRAMAVGSDYDSRPQSVLQRAPQRYPLGYFFGVLWGRRHMDCVDKKLRGDASFLLLFARPLSPSRSNAR
jgi:hypothetical protein